MKLKNVYHHLIHDGMYQSLDAKGNILEVNALWKVFLGYHDVDVEGRFIGEFISQASLLKLMDNLNRVILEGHLLKFECQLVKSSGEKVDVLLDGYASYDENGAFVQSHCYIFTLESYANMKQEIHYLKRQHDHLSTILNENVIYSSTDLDGIIVDVSDAFCLETGYKREEILGEKHNVLRSADMPSTIYDELWKTITAGKIWRGEIKNVRKNGESYWIRAAIHPLFDVNNTIEGFLAVRHDITREKIIEQASILDELTQLYNRRKFNADLAIAIEKYQRYGEIFALMLVDIDNFKDVNDTYGHLVGDDVLKGVSRFLRMQVRQGDLLARWGGEEFVIILPYTNKENAMKRADNFREKIGSTLCEVLKKSSDVHRYITCSIGVSVVMDNDSMDSLIGRVDRALYKAKDSGRNCIKFL